MKSFVRINSYILFAFLFSVSFVSAESLYFDNVNYSTERTYSNDNELVVFDFTIENKEMADVLRAFTLKNTGSATTGHTKSLTLWSDRGAVGFQGFAIDEKIGDLSYMSSWNSWGAWDLNIGIPVGSTRFFIVADIRHGITSERSFQLGLNYPQDLNGNGEFDYGMDLGFFFKEAKTEKIINVNFKNTLEIRSSSSDFLAPRVVIETGLISPIKLDSNEFTIKGFVRDRLTAGIKEFKVLFTKKESAQNWEAVSPAIVEGKPYFSWSYTKKDIEYDTPYLISIRAVDHMANAYESKPIELVFQSKKIITIILPNDSVVIKPKTNVSSQKSAFYVNRDLAIRAPFEDRNVFAMVKLRDANGDPIANTLVTIQATRPGKQIQMSLRTDEKGESFWELTGAIDSTFTFELIVDGVTLDFKPTVRFFDATLAGELIKSADSKAVYLLRDEKRYVFPHQSVYESYYKDFSKVRVVTGSELASYLLGGNITYRPGSLIKSPSMPIVYRVNVGGELNAMPSEAVARFMYGPSWASMVHDLSDALFVNYTLGKEIEIKIF